MPSREGFLKCFTSAPMKAATLPFAGYERGNCSKWRASTSLGAVRPPITRGRQGQPGGLSTTGFATPARRLCTLTFDQAGRDHRPLPDGLGKRTVKMLSLDPAELQGAEEARKTLIEVMK